jgi:hypothetical protein
MIRLAALALLMLLAACAPIKVAEVAKVDKAGRGYAGTVQKVYRVVRQSAELPGMRLFGQLGRALAPALRGSSETQQYVVRTPSGQIMAQSDEEFSVGECVEVVPESNGGSGPAFRYGEARVLRSDSCNEPQKISRL